MTNRYFGRFHWRKHAARLLGWRCCYLPKLRRKGRLDLDGYAYLFLMMDAADGHLREWLWLWLEKHYLHDLLQVFNWSEDAPYESVQGLAEQMHDNDLADIVFVRQYANFRGCNDLVHAAATSYRLPVDEDWRRAWDGAFD